MDWNSLYQQSQSFVGTSRFNALLGLVLFGGVGMVGASMAYYQIFKQARIEKQSGIEKTNLQRIISNVRWIGVFFGTCFGIALVGGLAYNAYASFGDLQRVEGTILRRHTKEYRGTQYFVSIQIKHAVSFGAKGPIATLKEKQGTQISLRVPKDIHQQSKTGQTIVAVVLGDSTVGVVHGKQWRESPTN